MYLKVEYCLEVIVKKIFFLITTFLIFFLVFANGRCAYSQTEPSTGLRFSSHEVIKDQRTSLNLTPEGPLSFPAGFSMEFDAMFRPGDGYFGYVFRIIGDEKVNIDLVSNFWSSTTTFSVVYKDSALYTFKWDDIPNGGYGSWIKVKVEVDKESNLSVSLNGHSKKEKIKGISDLKNFHIEFGSCKFSSFLTTDVSPMTVKNIAIYDDGQQIRRKWELAKHRENSVYDEFTQAKATVHYPNWEINNHLEWKKEKSFYLNNLIGVAKDEETGRIFLVDDQAVYVCTMETFIIDTLESLRIDTLTFTKGNPFPCKGNQIIYNPLTDELWSYNFTRENISKFDFTTRTWSLSEQDCLAPDLWHHSSFLSPKDTTLITFGGYGYFTYKSLFNRYSLKSEKWEQNDLFDHIPPRYMNGMGPYGKEKVLVFGGFGSKTGKQEISPNFYYDLYSIDEKGVRAEKLWDLGVEDSPFVPTQALLTDPKSNSFYTLIYNPVNFETSLKLAQFSIDEPEKILYADSIPYKFLDTESWSTVFLNKKASKLIALTTYNTEINLYSLAYPPLLPSAVFQEEVKASSSSKILFGLVLIGFAITATSVFLIPKKRSKLPVVKDNPAPEFENEGNTLSTSAAVQRKTNSSIYVLGGFQVFDKNGSDITANFTPTLKQLFLLIFFSSARNGKGVSSMRLDEILWFDKTEESARNNRNVNISKLRVLFKSIDHIDLEYNGTSWKITFGNNFYSDYTEAWQLINKSRSSASLQEDEIFRLIQIASWGELCPNIQAEWIDKFKVDFANELINTLTVLSNNIPQDSQNRYDLLFAISDCILKFDPLNEEAIALKCSSLYHSGKKTFAKQSYDLFCREYKHLLGGDFPISFQDLINNKKNPVS